MPCSGSHVHPPWPDGSMQAEALEQSARTLPAESSCSVKLRVAQDSGGKSSLVGNQSKHMQSDFRSSATRVKHKAHLEAIILSKVYTYCVAM